MIASFGHTGAHASQAMQVSFIRRAIFLLRVWRVRGFRRLHFGSERPGVSCLPASPATFKASKRSAGSISSVKVSSRYVILPDLNT